MVKLVRNCAGNIVMVIFALLNFQNVQRIDGYTLQMPESDRESMYPSPDSEETSNGPVPSCNSTTFCTDTPYYPTDLVDVLLSGDNHLKYLATIDESVEPYRQDFTPDGEALCSSQEMVVMPRTALSVGGLWLYVVNYKNYVQAVRVEICTAEKRPCKVIDGFSDGWKTTCKQTYIYRQLVAITRDGSIAPQLFKLPSSCKCFIKYTGDPFMRLHSRPKNGKAIKNSPNQRLGQ
ncbi:protein spaetzle-like [Venturia canescens]|uniref:protein spaetzle-like n=1 Tax=Venturia canescens TaxID=32260 RepID=UPI001C9BC485|nr:protein spaetzle-like [Venturia canescens]